MFPDYVCIEKKKKTDNSICFIYKDNFRLTFEINTSCSRNEDCVTNLCSNNQYQINNNFSYFYCIIKYGEFSYECNSINENGNLNGIYNNIIKPIPMPIQYKEDNLKEKDYAPYIMFGLYIYILLTILFTFVCCYCKNPSKDGIEELIKKKKKKMNKIIIWKIFCNTCTRIGIGLAISVTILFMLSF